MKSHANSNYSDASSTWKASIAKRAGVSVDEVSTLFARTGIRPSPVPATPSRLHINRIEFIGEKVATKSPAMDGKFHFVWEALTPGEWVMMTDGNFKGKSSVIEIVKWLLRGEPPSSLQSDVQSWLRQASMDFCLDEKLFRVEFAGTNDHFEGKLVQKNRATPLVLTEFFSPSAFQETMSSFFMKELDLDIIQAFRQNSEEPSTHDWSSLSGVFFIGTDYKALLGDVVMDGLQSRLLGMYLGLPWISTLSTAQANLKLADREQNRRENQTVEERNRRAEKLNQINKNLEGHRLKLLNTPSDENTRKQHRAATEKLTQISHTIRELDAKHTVLARVRNEAFEAFNDDRREQLLLQEGKAAQTIFRALNPEVCPRCDGDIGEERRKREQETHECSVCGEQTTDDNGDFENLRQIVDERVNASQNAYEQSRAAVEGVEIRLGELRTEEDSLNLECDRLGRILSGGFDNYHDLRAEIRMLEKEQESLQVTLEGPDQPQNHDLAILKATVEETEKQVAKLKNELLSEVSQEIVRLSREIGMTAITSATLRGNATLAVTKGGQDTTYSKLTGGEKLRLKVATVLAMLSVAEKKGVGRYPGLLFIDSPTNNEMIDDDFENLLKGLRATLQAMPHLQVFIASTSSTVLQQWIEPAKLKYARGEEYLW